MDLTAAGNTLDAGFNRVYVRHFLATLKPKTQAQLQRFPSLVDARRLAQARTLRAFDDLVTAPLHGFRDADDYWRRASSKPLLRHIALPTLLINARNDPFLPVRALPQADEVAATVALEFPASGGHVGFVTGAFPGTLEWLPQRVFQFFDRVHHEII
jgi:predicted alpha/beta-fold hydrolase